MASPTDPIAVVRVFLAALAEPDTERATSLLSPDIEWLITGTLRGFGPRPAR